MLAETPDGAGVRFAHALIREALYEGIPLPRAARVHRRAAEALLATADPDPDAVAYHLQRAGDPRAVEWLVRAGRPGAAGLRLPTAAERYEAALALLDRDAATAAERGWLLLHLARSAALLRTTRRRHRAWRRRVAPGGGGRATARWSPYARYRPRVPSRCAPATSARGWRR